MADINSIATLSVTIDGRQAIAQTNAIGASLDQMAAKGAAATTRVQGVAQAIETAARSGFSAATITKSFGVSFDEATAAVQRYGGAAAATAAVTKQVGAASAVSAGFLDQLAGSTHAGSLGMSYLRREILSVAATMTNTNPILARLGFTLSALGGNGKLAITAIVGLAAAGLAIKAGTAIYEKLNATAIANAKAFEQWQKSAEGVAAQARADQEAVSALSGTFAASTIIVHGQTAALEELRKALADTRAQLTKPAAQDALGQAAMHSTGLGANLGGDLMDPGNSGYTALNQLRTAFQAGKISADDMRRSLVLLGAQFGQTLAPGIVQTYQFVEALTAEREQIAKLNDEQSHAAAVSIEQAAALEKEASFASKRLGVAGSGGAAAVQRLDQEHEAVRRATEDWDAYIKSTEGAAYAGLTYTEALVAKNAQAVREHDLALQAVRDNERTTQTLKAQADALRELAAIRDRSITAADRSIPAGINHAVQSVLGPEQSQAAFDTKFQQSIDARKQENDAIQQQIDALRQSKQAYEDVLVTQAGSKAALEAIAQANAEHKTITTKQIEEARRLAEAHERLTQALKDGKQAADDAAKDAKRDTERQARALRRMIENDAPQLAAQLINQWFPSLTNPNTSGGRFGGSVEVGLEGAVKGGLQAGPAGAIVEGVTSFVSSLISSGAKAKQAAREFAVASSSFQASLAGFVSAGQSIATPGGLNAQILAIKAQAASLQQSADQVYGHHKDDAANSAAVAAINAAEAQRIEYLRQEHDLLIKTTAQSLEARKLAAEGQTQAAAALNLQIQQEQEYQKDVEAGWTATQLATLKQVQAMEAVRAAADGLSSSFLNLNDGFRVMSDWFHAQQPQMSGPSILPKMPSGGNGGSGGATTIVVPFIADGKTISTLVVNTLKRTAAAQLGDSKLWSQVQ